MPLDTQEIEIPLNLGMATKPSEELQEPSAMRVVQNLHWRSQGEIEKRPVHNVSATVAASASSDYGETVESSGLIVRDNDVCAISAQHGLLAYSSQQGFRYPRSDTPAASSPNVTLKYRPVSYDLTRRHVHATQNNKSSEGIRNCCGAQYNGIQVVAWMEVHASGNRLCMKAIDPFTGTEIANTEYLAGLTGTLSVDACECTQSGKEGVLIAYVSGSAAPYTISTYRYDAAANQFVADSALTTNAKTAAYTIQKFGARIFFGYTDNTSGFLTVEDRTIALAFTTHTATHGGDGGVSVVQGTSTHLIVSNTTTTAYAEVFGTPANKITLMTASSESFIGGITGARETRANTTQDAVVWVNSITSVSPVGQRVRCIAVNFDATTPTTDATTVLPHCKIVAGAFTLRGGAHVPLVVAPYNDTSANRTCFIARAYAKSGGGLRCDAVVRLMHDTFFEPPVILFDNVRNGVYVDSYSNAWSVYTGDLPVNDTSSGLFPQSVYLCRINAARPMPMAYAAPERGVAMVAGGVLWEFDGETASEAAPLIKPIVSVDFASGSGLTGDYGVVAVYTWVDAAGRLHRMPSDPVLASSAADNQLDVYVSKCPMRTYDGSFTNSDMEPELYLTANGVDVSGSEYFLMDASTKLLYSSATSDGLWYKFTDVDPANTSAIPLAAPPTGGELPPEPPPAFSHVSKVVDRMVAINAEDRSEIWYSKPIVDGYAVEWITDNKLRIEDECVAIADMGLGICVLARGGIYLVDGEGPDATGVGAFSPARKLNHTVDCIDPVSVCRTPMGVMFRGRRGFYMLGNDMNAQPFAVPIDPDVITDPASDPSTSATYRTRVVFQEQTNEIHITGLPGAGAAYKYVYNVIEDKWSRYVTSAITYQDVAVARGKLWALVRSAGTTDLLRDEKLYSVDGAAYNSDTAGGYEIDTPWYRLDHVSGQSRLWRAWFAFKLPTDVSDVTSIAIAYYVDNSVSAQQTVTFTGATLNTYYSTTGEVARLPFVPNLQVVQSFRFVITCAFTGATSGPKPLSIRLKFGNRPSKGKRNRLEPKG